MRPGFFPFWGRPVMTGAVGGGDSGHEKIPRIRDSGPSGPKHSRNLSARRRLSACQLGRKANTHGKKPGLRTRYSKTTTGQPKHHHAQRRDTKQTAAPTLPNKRKPTPELATVSLVERGWGTGNARVCSIMRNRSMIRATRGCAEPPPRIYIDYRCFGGFCSMVWAVCLVVLGLCCGGRVFVFCFGGERFCCFV